MSVDRSTGDTVMESISLHRIGCLKLRVATEDQRTRITSGFELPLSTQKLVGALNDRIWGSLSLLLSWVHIYEAHRSVASDATHPSSCLESHRPLTLTDLECESDRRLYERLKEANGLRERADVKLFIGDLEGGCDDLAAADAVYGEAASGLVEALPPSPPGCGAAAQQSVVSVLGHSCNSGGGYVSPVASALSSFRQTLGNTTAGPTGLGGPVLVAGVKDCFCYLGDWRSQMGICGDKLRSLATSVIDQAHTQADTLETISR